MENRFKTWIILRNDALQIRPDPVMMAGIG